MITNKERTINRIIAVYSVLMLMLQKIAIHIGEFEFSIAFFLFTLLLFQLGLHRRVQINKRRLMVYILFLVMTMISCAVNAHMVKYTSYLLLIILYFMVCFDIKLSNNNKARLRRVVIRVLLLSAIIGIIQFLMQLAGMQFFDIFDMVPNSIKLSGFNTYYPLSYGSKLIKSNGWIYLEPSFFSQFMALGIIIVLNDSNRQFDKKTIAFLILFILGLIFSFSGTGILLLIVAFIPSIRKLSIKNRFLVIIGGLVAVFVFSRSQYFYSVSDRLFEVTVSGSSGAIRFVNPYIVAFGSQNQSFFLGRGAGMADDLNYFFVVNHNAITKIMIEYGFFTLLVFIPFISMVFLRNQISTTSVSVLLMFLFLSGNLLQPSILFVLFLMVDLEPKTKTQILFRRQFLKNNNLFEE